MIKRKQRRTLLVRVEYEPNRFSQDCLQQTYQAFSPTVATSLSKVAATEETESEQEDGIDAQRAPETSQ